MEASENCSVKVVHIRLLIGDERSQGCREFVTVTTGKPQVKIGTRSLTFDHVYGNGGSPSSSMCDEYIAPLVDGLFQGYNATVLAYGQTGSGKTYTMGTATEDDCQKGLIPQVMNALFEKNRNIEASSRVPATCFLHRGRLFILKEEVRDLLDSEPVGKLVTPKGNAAKVAFPGKSSIQIRESSNGVITLAGSTEVAISTLQEMATCLEQGSISRATGSTNMNNQSSRSHAIFTITIEQVLRIKSVSSINNAPDEAMTEEYLCAKLHLLREKDLEIKDIKQQLKNLTALSWQSEAQKKEFLKEQNMREHAVAISLATSATEVKILCVQMVPVGHLSMKKLKTMGKNGKLWWWKRSHNQWLLQFRWKWQKHGNFQNGSNTVMKYYREQGPVHRAVVNIEEKVGASIVALPEMSEHTCLEARAPDVAMEARPSKVPLGRHQMHKHQILELVHGPTSESQELNRLRNQYLQSNKS
ncbi:Leucine-rich repeat protein kinase family protein, putative isoform 1 [Hibiscus syriacus]|uniref:Leucine-rich repeat protein kinase family protein, putative isoform 1 n=1 Tax=Hibiscus syriacus TaxID=106335 RepID=A0A6A2XBG2_HIBSY|nr:Leucine-rich repeat protein kinase family protein, putative isoform 1 [Hibiscus syriacus]